MNGFGYCVWWKICKQHPIVLTSLQLSDVFHSPSTPLHISVRTKMSVVPSEIPYNTSLIKARLPLRVTSEYIPSWKKTLYALELPVGQIYPLPRNPHVTLAYRLNKDFSNDEILLATNLLTSYDDWSNIRKVESVVYDVTSPTFQWTRVK
jgi:hypothetical protein